MAVMELEPTDKKDVEIVAISPFNSLTDAPNGILPLKNDTVPVGVPAPGAFADTVAVKVTDWPKTDGLADDVTTVVVSALLTVWVSADVPELPEWVESPPYVALIVTDPATGAGV